jgi:hypothetical protein
MYCIRSAAGGGEQHSRRRGAAQPAAGSSAAGGGKQRSRRRARTDGDGRAAEAHRACHGPPEYSRVLLQHSLPPWARPSEWAGGRAGALIEWAEKMRPRAMAGSRQGLRASTGVSINPPALAIA